MKKFLSGFCATAIAASVAIGGVIPVTAAPIAVPRAAPEQSDVINAQATYDNIILNQRRGRHVGDRYMRDVQQGWRGGDWRDGRRGWRDGRRDWRESRRDWRRDDRGFYRGYRGYRDYRPGYRRHGNLWFPAAAFLAGALATGAIANSQPRYVGNAHVQWCYDRYRSYRASDNTFQPYNGPRQQCYSPY